MRVIEVRNTNLSNLALLVQRLQLLVVFVPLDLILGVFWLQIKNTRPVHQHDIDIATKVL